MAELWKLPVVYVIENNRYAMGTSVMRSSAQTNLSKRGVSFNIPGEQVDGMDVRAVKAAGAKAVEWVRAGNGPYILEMLTYRYRGHSMSDPAKYRSREEVNDVRQHHDPIEMSRARILEKKFASEDELKAMEKRVRDQISAGRRFCSACRRAGPGRIVDRRLSLGGQGAPSEPRGGGSPAASGSTTRQVTWTALQSGAGQTKERPCRLTF